MSRRQQVLQLDPQDRSTKFVVHRTPDQMPGAKSVQFIDLVDFPPMPEVVNRQSSLDSTTTGDQPRRKSR